MAETHQPGFQRLATDDDDSRWRAHQAALRRVAAARKAGITPSPEATQGVEPPAASRVSPVLLGGGLAVAAAVILAAPLFIPRFGPARLAPEAAPKTTRGQSVPAPITAGPSLPCYVNGVSLGVLSLTDCAAREGLAIDKLNSGPRRPPTSAVSPVGVSGQAVPDRVPAVKPPPPPAAARVVQAPPPARIVPRPVIAQAPPRPARPPPAVQSGPYAERLDDSDLATVDARREVEDAPSAAESAQAAGDFYKALGKADGARAAALVVPEKRRGGPLSAPAIDRFFSTLSAPLRITALRPLDNHTVAVRYQYIDPQGLLCSGSSEVDTTVRGERVLVQGIRVHSRC